MQEIQIKSEIIGSEEAGLKHPFKKETMLDAHNS